MEDGAIVVLNNSPDEVLAWVGSLNEHSKAADVDGVTALRQPGSPLKSLFVCPDACRAANHSRVFVRKFRDLNSDREFKGMVSNRAVQGASLNMPAGHTLLMMSPDGFAKPLKKAGFPFMESGDFYGFSLALGSPEAVAI